MDERFRNEGTEDINNAADSNYPVKSSLGDFSVNIDTKSDADAPKPAPKKFEVHIPDIDKDAEEEPIVQSARVTAPPRRPDRSTISQGRPQQNPNYAVSQRRNGNSLADAANRTAYGQRAPQSFNQGRPQPGRPVDPALRAEQRKKAQQNAKMASQARKKAAKKRGTTEADRRRKSMRRYTFVKGLLITCVCLIFISMITMTVSTIALSVINDILVIDKDDSYTVTVEIPEGADYEQVFQIFADKGLIKQPFLTDFFCRFRHYDTVEYLSGTFFIDSDIGVEKMLESVMESSDYAKDTIRLTFPEGFTVAEIFDKIDKYEVCEANKLYANLNLIGEQYSFISDITKLEGRYLKAEGYLFPDTYDFYIGENASSVIDKLLANFNSRWTSEYDERLKELGMTMDQVMTIASIVQREAKDGSQMADISSVIHNRLKDTATYPTLDLNSTTDYITMLNTYNLFTDVYYSLYLDSYNTYSKTGLPPGPICNPGETAIHAALYPSDTKYYFFCHDEEGEVYYAETAEEHEKNTSLVLYGGIGGELDVE